MLDNIGVTIPLVVVLVLLLVVVIAQKQRRDPLRAIPGPKPYPIIGNVYEMIQIEAVELFLQWCAEYGKILKYKVFLLGTQVMISDAEALKHILVNNYSNYKKPESLLMPVRKIFGSRCMICLPQHEHALRRKILNPAFNTSSIRNKTASIRNKTYSWRSGSVVQVEADLSCLTLDILGDCMFGYNFNCIGNPDNALTAALHRLMSVQDMNFLRFLPFYKFWPTRINQDLRLIKKFVYDIIEYKENSSPGDDKTDMLDLMLQSRDVSSSDNRKQSLSNDDIIDDIILFLVAGHETATNVLSWTMYELSKHTDIQRQCREEITRVVGEDGHLTYESCKRLTFVECCIKEAMRLYPPVPLTCRQNIEDDTLGGYLIPAGTTIALQLGAMMRHRDYFPHGDSFIPSRFLDDAHNRTFLPFLSGPDMCIGNRFAMLEMKLIISVMLENCEFELTADANFRGSQGLTYHMEPPLYLVANKISHGEQK